MHADEDRVRINKIEFYVPSVPLEDVDFDALERMERRLGEKDSRP
jgi:hypothetical protein